MFGRRKRRESVLLQETEEGENVDSSPQRSVVGPFDITEIEDVSKHVDLGSLLIAPSEQLHLRLEVEEETQRVVSVTLDLQGSSLQVQAFAAPRTRGIWGEVRGQIAQSVLSQGGEVEEKDGTFGAELFARLPARSSDLTGGFRAARFIGVDGPRWFLRGVIGGAAASEPEAAVALERIFRSFVIQRGSHPLPPRELLPLRLPPEAKETN